MAMYHFRIKSDKKPDGTRISPVQHVEYIRREGKYEEDKFVGNIISTAEMENADEGLLYKTDEYGAIRKTSEGIEITEKRNNRKSIANNSWHRTNVSDRKAKTTTANNFWQCRFCTKSAGSGSNF